MHPINICAIRGASATCCVTMVCSARDDSTYTTHHWPLMLGCRACIPYPPVAVRSRMFASQGSPFVYLPLISDLWPISLRSLMTWGHSPIWNEGVEWSVDILFAYTSEQPECSNITVFILYYIICITLPWYIVTCTVCTLWWSHAMT